MGKFLRARSGRRRIASVATAVVVAALLTSVEVAQPPRADAAIGAIVWQDEFNGAANTPPDPSKWRYDIGGHGWGNNELQYYTSSVSNAAHNGQGQMVITARRENPANHQCYYGRCQYTSARLLTQGRYANTYGRFEARIKIPRGQGIWPAFWMLGDNIGSVGWPASGEIDIMENIGREPNTVHGTLHGPGYSGANASPPRPTCPGAPPSPTASTRSRSTGHRMRSRSSSTACPMHASLRPTPAAMPGFSTIRSS